MPQQEASRLAAQLDAIAEKLDSHNNPARFSDSWGWQASTLGTRDLSYVARKIAERIRSVDWSDSDSKSEISLKNLADKAELAVANNAQNVFAGLQASEALQTLLSNIDIQVDTIINPTQLRRASVIPQTLRRAVTNAVERLNSTTNSIDGIEEKVASINSAYEASKRLPTTLEDLENTISEIEKIKLSAAKHELATQQHMDAAKSAIDALARAQQDADTTLTKVRSAYRAATSEGLAHSFDDKSKKLQTSVQLWLGVLIIALSSAGALAFFRVPEVLKTLNDTQTVGVLLVRFMLGAAVIAPPVWLAWVATKQIGQRFRLAEDYAYKAALSAAYEGYKAEAEGLDPLLEAELFATALGRLDEIPLRLVEQHVHGSPLHDLLQTHEFKEAVEKTPELKTRLIKILKPDNSKNPDETEST